MTDRQQNQVLNALLIDLGRSLLQYAAEAWPWTNSSSVELQDEVDILADRQAQLATAIADYLIRRDWPVDFGIYSVDYTDLNYVSLDFLLGRIKQNAEELVTETHETRRLIDDAEASELLVSVEDEQRSIAARLRELAEHAKQLTV